MRGVLRYLPRGQFLCADVGYLCLISHALALRSGTTDIAIFCLFLRSNLRVATSETASRRSVGLVWGEDRLIYCCSRLGPASDELSIGHLDMGLCFNARRGYPTVSRWDQCGVVSASPSPSGHQKKKKQLTLYQSCYI